MNRGRRTFLTGVGATAAVSGHLLAPASATAASEASSATNDMPRGMTLATIRRGGAWSLVLKTARGLLDVYKAEARRISSSTRARPSSGRA
jgi:hypothetical protein